MLHHARIQTNPGSILGKQVAKNKQGLLVSCSSPKSKIFRGPHVQTNPGSIFGKQVAKNIKKPTPVGFFYRVCPPGSGSFVLLFYFYSSLGHPYVNIICLCLSFVKCRQKIS